MTLSEYCKSTLYCLVFQTRSVETVVFIQAGTKVAAIRKAMDTLACLYDVPLKDVTLTHIAGHRDLVAKGVSDVECFRIFETSWRQPMRETYTSAPLFLSNDPSLLGTWAAYRFEALEDARAGRYR